jgi:mono/diheme cytochrome c family protein
MPAFRWILIVAILAAPAAAEETPAQRGYRFLATKPYLPLDFDQETFDRAWEAWPEPLRSQAEKASPDERRRMAFSRYGLTGRPENPALPLQYVVDERGNWTMNCFACHGGKVAGRVVPGLPNSHLALLTLTEETRQIKVETGKPLSRMDVGSAFMPLGTTNGTTNAVMFGVVLLAMRDAELNVHADRLPPPMVHHDMDPPPWWHFHKRKNMYIDGFAGKGHRGLMQFMLVKQNGPEKFREWEDDFRDVYAYLESLRPPKYPYEIDEALAARGRAAFENACARCHGTYGDKETYPNRVVPIGEVGTDRARFDALTPEHRAHYAATWFADYGRDETVSKPAGYVAPPLDGIWATAPYFHNGSVPTLWHVLHPAERPVIWKRSEDGYDRQRVGLEATTYRDRAPIRRLAELREYFDTRRFGKSAAGHLFPDELTEEEKRAVLEYLKTL